MSGAEELRDLAVLVADRDMQAAVEGLFARPEALRIRRIQADVFVHPHHDPGCLRKSPEFLRAQTARYQFAMVMFDREGCGSQQSRENLEGDVENRLRDSGWQDRACAIVIEPELEAWVWSDSPHVDDVLSWSDRLPDLRTWLRQEGLITAGASKPINPKPALELALRSVQRPRSSSLYANLAAKVSVDRCEDLAFQKFKDVMKKWFSPNRV